MYVFAYVGSLSSTVLSSNTLIWFQCPIWGEISLTQINSQLFFLFYSPSTYFAPIHLSCIIIAFTGFLPLPIKFYKNY